MVVSQTGDGPYGEQTDPVEGSSAAPEGGTSRRKLLGLVGGAGLATAIAMGGVVAGRDEADAAVPSRDAARSGRLGDPDFDVPGNLNVQGPRPWADPRAFGARGDGAHDDAPAFQAAVTRLAQSGGILLLTSGTYRLDSPIAIPGNVDVRGAGPIATVLDGRGPGATLTASAQWFEQRFSGFTITHENNTNTGVNMVDATQGANSCVFDTILLFGQPGATGNGFVIRGVNPANNTPNNNQYNNLFLNCRTAAVNYGSKLVDGVAVYLYGQDINNARCNANELADSVFDGFATGIFLNGNGNLINRITFNQPTFASIHMRGDSGTVDNVISNSYVDSGASGARVLLEKTVSTSLHMTYIISSVGISKPTDVTLGGAYPSNTRFTLMGRNWYSGSVSPTAFSTPNAQIVGGSADNGVLQLVGGLAYNSGGMLLSGPAYAGSVNAVSNSGGASGVINDSPSAQFRIVKTANGASFTVLSSVDSTGNQRLLGGVSVGGGTLITRHLSRTTSISSLPALAAGTSTSVQVSAPGTAVGDTVVCSYSPSLPPGVAVFGSVSSGGEVTVTFANLSAANVVIPDGTARIDAWQH